MVFDMQGSVGSGRSKQTSRERIKRDLRAIRIVGSRVSGQTLAAIAAAEGISISRVAQIIDNHLSSKRSASVAELRRLEAERLDALQTAVWPKAMRGNLNAVTTSLSIMSRRAKLLGLDANASLQGEDWKAEWIAESEAVGASVKAKLYAAHARLLKEETTAAANMIEGGSSETLLSHEDRFKPLKGLDNHEPDDEIYGERSYRSTEK